MLHKEIPFLRIGLPLCVGIISGLYFKPGNIFLIITAITVITGFCASMFYNRSPVNLLFGFTLTIALFTCGILLYSDEKESLSLLKPETSLFHCSLSDFPEEKENSYRLKLKLHSKIAINGPEAVKGSLIVYNKKDVTVTSLLPGDELVIKCTPIEIVNRGNPYEFNYRFYMENQGIKYLAFTSSLDIIIHTIPHHRSITHMALIIRDKIISMYKERGITGERLAVVAAVTLGQKNMLEPEQKQNFMKAGVMHIMAVSGLHVGIISLFVFNILFFLKRRFNILRAIITILILWSFAFVTGLTPSVLRATLMFSFLQTGNLMKRRVNSINSVLASAFILIIIKPSSIFDAGFLLSHSAVIFIISFYRGFYQMIHLKNRITDKLWQSATVTIVAQAGTLPLTIMLFNRFPTYFLLTNIIIIPLVTLLIICGCLIPITYPIHYLSELIALLIMYLTGVTESLTAQVSYLPWSTMENIGMTTTECIMLTITIFLFSCYIMKRESIPIKLPLAILLLYATISTLSEISTRTTNELIVYNTPGSSTIGIRTGKILNLYSETSGTGPEVKKECATLGLTVVPNILGNRPYYIRIDDKKILISNSLSRASIKHLNPDIVIFTGSKPVTKDDLTTIKNPEALIVTSCPYTKIQPDQHNFFTDIDTVHLVKRSGAFIMRI